MKKSITKFVLAVGLFAAGVICIGHAENVSATKIHLRVSPTGLEHDLNPGDKVDGTFTVENDGDNILYYSTKATPYYATSKDDSNSIDVSYDKESTFTQIANWITFANPEGQIEPNSSIEIKYTINVPESTPGGGQYSALLVTTRDTKNDVNNNDVSSVSEVASIGPVVYAKVSGNIIEKGEIISNEINGFMFNPPISASSKVKNTGNVHAKVTYTLRVYPLFSNESIYNNEENPGTATVLPEGTRYYTASWTAEQGAPSIGIYKVQSEVKIFDQVSKIEKIVIICPMWVLILIAVFIIAVIFWIIARAKGRKTEA